MGWLIVLGGSVLAIFVVGIIFLMRWRENRYIASNTELNITLIDRTREIAIAAVSAHYLGWSLGDLAVLVSQIREIKHPKHVLHHLIGVINVKEYLVQRYMVGDRAYFPYAMQTIFSNKDFNERLLEDHEGMPLSPVLLRCYIYNLRCCAPTLKKYGVDLMRSDAKVVLGFDMAELIIEVRYFLAVGRLDEKLALDFIHQAHSATVAESLNWKELSKSYLLGLAMIAGNGPRFKDAIKQCVMFQKNSHSIWRHVDLIE